MGKNSALKLYNNAVARLTRKSEYFKKYRSIYHWIYTEDENIVNAEIRYLEYIKNYVIKRYWDQDIFISGAALDDIIFDCISNHPHDKVLSKIDEAVKGRGLNKDSIVIFPLNNFGFKHGGLGKLFRTQSLSYSYQNFEVYSQTNSLKNSIKNVVAYMDKIKLPNANKLELDLFEHFYRSRRLKWFDNNPLLIMHFKFSQYERYDNLQFIIIKLQFVTTKLYFLDVFINEESHVGSLFSTSNTNSWATKDINHFLTITTTSKNCTLNCLPVHFGQFEIYELMNMNIDLKVKKKAIVHWQKNAVDAIDVVYAGYMRFLLKKQKADLKFNRIANSLKYFRRSMKSNIDEDRIINLNIALETLLLDKHENKKRDKMLERIWNTLKYKINKKQNLKTIEIVISERNEIIHHGAPTSQKIDFIDAYRTYAKLVLFIIQKIDTIDSTKRDYLSSFYS